MPENPCPHSAKSDEFPLSFRATLTDVPERNDLLIELSFRNAHTDAPATASTSGERLFSRSPSACQEQNSDQFYCPELGEKLRIDVTLRLPSSSDPQEVPMQRSIAAIMAVFNSVNGLVMLFASSVWWESIPGVPDTGPFNPHFVQDVGAAFLVTGLALAARAWRPIY